MSNPFAHFRPAHPEQSIVNPAEPTVNFNVFTFDNSLKGRSEVFKQHFVNSKCSYIHDMF